MKSLYCLLAGMLWLGTINPAVTWTAARPDYKWSFPRDHWTHPGYRTEWWYFTGHLESLDQGGQFAFQMTFFRLGLQPARPDGKSNWNTANLVMAHAAISNHQRRDHIFSEVLLREMPLLAGFNPFPQPLIAWSLAPPGTGGKWTLRWNGEGFDFSMADRASQIAFSLSTWPSKPLVFQGPNGYSLKSSEGGASQYYSFTRMTAEGQIELEGKSHRVRGTTWMDHEFGSSWLAPQQVGWDWFALQMKDGRELMLFILRNKNKGMDFAHATLVSDDGRVKYMKKSEWDLVENQTWISKTSGGQYPAGWRIRVGGEQWSVRPRFADQENRSRLRPGLVYWEGAITVEDLQGRSVGSGYVELTGYAPGSRPPL